MATVQSSLKLFDAMSRPLQNITQSMNLMISTMHQMQAATDKNVNIDKTLTAAKQRIAAAEADIRQAIDQANAAQQKFNRSVQQGKDTASDLKRTIGGIAAAYLTFEAARRTWEATVVGAMQQQQMIDTFSARAGNEAVGGAIFDQITKQALKFGQNVDEALSGTMSFISNTLDPKKLADMNLLAMRLAKLNPAEGLEGAAFSMKELLSGDYTSIVERFNMGRSMIQNSEALKAGKAGDLDGFIKGMDKLLDQQNMTQEAFEKMLDSPAAKWQKILQTFRFQLAQTGADGLAALAPLFDLFTTSLDSGKFDPFFKALNAGIWLVANMLYGAAQAGMFLYGVAVQYWPEITAAVLSLAVVYLPMITAALWQMLVPIYQAVAAWLTLNWPIALVIGAIVVLTATLRHFGVTTQQMVGFVVGVFYILYAAVQNTFALIYNTLLAFVEFFANLFIDPVYAVKKLFYDLSKNIADYFWSAINGIIKGINWVIEAINKIKKTEIALISTVDTSAIDKFKPTSNKDVFDLSKYRMNQLDYAGSFNTGFQAGQGMVNKMASALDGFQLPGGKGDIANVDRVGSVGKIDDTVDISSEDLKVMRELAEMKNIQNFVTLTPTVSVQTGPIQNGYDVDTIIARIETALTEQIASSARGVYG
ncbi:hypothetical protein [Paenibacillus naphthalenovorans]|uniref:hypothetical protein n=1 Tax=Paenibacillus naphthalenovorans TaxID=162209 RepID=UPI00088988E4|nr:hypothetical protein [Paenibacillus naphthalenovorans]SDJ76346.1 hypothetical protein SAMN05421868_14317 [Paenibacillus naphthalenovorans]